MSMSDVSCAAVNGDAHSAIHLQNLDNSVNIKPRTRSYWRECLDTLQKSWSELSKTEIRKMKPLECKEWAALYAKKVSPTRYNNTVAVLRHVLDIAVEVGVIYANPAAAVKRAPVRQTQISLPATEKFNALIAEMASGHGRDSQNCADLAAAVAFTGCRIGEAREIEWRDIDFNAGELVVRGDAATGTKNW